MRTTVSILLLVACSEYDLSSPDPYALGVPNPVELDTSRVVDRLEQVNAPKADILWVVDSSRSMRDENDQLAEWFPLFIQHFEDTNADFHIGVVDTDMGLWGSAGELRDVGGVRWIDRDTEDPVGVFSLLTDVYNPVSDTAGYEKGREAAYTALELKANDANAGFLRGRDAWLHITVVSDEDDSSTADPISRTRFVEWINEIRPDTYRTTFNSIVTLHVRTGVETVGEKYLDLTDQIGGEVFDLQESLWPDMLDTLGGLQAPPPLREWYLSEQPIADTIEVTIEHLNVVFVFDPLTDWTYDPIRNSIRFTEYEVPAGAEVFVSYLPAASIEP